MADVADTLQRLLDDPEVLAAAEQAEAESQAIPTGQDSLLGALPPDLMGKLPALMGALGPVLGAGGKKDEKTALLLALKPYMSPQRCDAIDKLIMLGRIGEVFRQLR